MTTVPAFFYKLAELATVEFKPIDDKVEVYLHIKDGVNKRLGKIPVSNIPAFLNELVTTNHDLDIPFSNKLRIKLLSLKKPITIPDKETFKRYLITSYQIMKASVPLMDEAAYDIKCLDVGLLKLYYDKHSMEEKYHDEWVLNDLESIGVSREHVASLKPSQSVAELVGSQYYWIHHFHPVVLLGYIAFLEGDPPEKEFIERLQKKTGYPDSAFRTIAKHGYLDPNHLDDMDKLLDSLPLTQDHMNWIMDNAVYSSRKFAEIYHL
jgi:Iron-containing redox enzyme